MGQFVFSESLTTYQIKASAGPGRPGGGWWSIILDGELSQVKDPEEIKAIGDKMEAQNLFPPGLKEKFMKVILDNPEQSNIFKMEITGWGGKELAQYRPEDEIT